MMNPAIEAFNAAVRLEVQETGCTRIEAVRRIAVRDPQMHAAYVEAVNTQ